MLGRQPVIEPDAYEVSVRTAGGARVLDEAFDLRTDVEIEGRLRP